MAVSLCCDAWGLAVDPGAPASPFYRETAIFASGSEVGPITASSLANARMAAIRTSSSFCAEGFARHIRDVDAPSWFESAMARRECRGPEESLLGGWVAFQVCTVLLEGFQQSPEG